MREPGAPDRSGTDRAAAGGPAGSAAFLISCGGTGGHLAPGIALAEELAARGHRVTLLISEKPVDGRLAAKYPQFQFARVPGAPFGWRPGAALRCLVQQSRGLVLALRQLRALRPRAVIGFGGFTSGAAIVAAAACRVPVVLHEANHVPGRAIRTFAPLARRVYLPPGVRLGGRARPQVVEAGLPVRREIQPAPRAVARSALGLELNHPMVAVLGGSQGASSLNAWARAAAPVLAREGVQVCCVTGEGKGAAEVQSWAGPAETTLCAHFIPFCDRMGTLLSAADLVVSRAGAGTMAELIRCHTPAILVPYPFAADNHQAANAAYLAREGGAQVLAQAEVPGRLTAEVRAWLRDPKRLADCRALLQRLDRHNAVQLMADDLEQISPRRGPKSYAAGRPAAA